MLREPAHAVHTLLRVTALHALQWDEGPPDWAGAALLRGPWVVVRRSAPRPGSWPVGVRGSLRAQRAAAWLPDAAVGECVTPQMLVARGAWRRRPPTSGLTPAVAALDQAAGILQAQGFASRWGPGGSVGFELASGETTTTASSDLDLVLSAAEPVARAAAERLHEALCTLPVRVDVLLETPLGGVALSEYAAGGTMRLRCAAGARLVRDPWAMCDSVTEA